MEGSEVQVVVAPVVPAACEIVTIPTHEVPAFAGQMAAVVRAATSFLPLAGLREDPERTIQEHARMPGFTCVAARPGLGAPLIAFAYGWSAGVDRSWVDLIGGALDVDDRRHWLSDAFRLAALATTDEFRRCGDVRVLHDSLLIGTPHRSAVIAAPDGDSVLELCRSTGWARLGSMLTPDQPPLVVMGRPLPFA